ncbi:hypothetical protein SEUCBS139899_002002 [Sporothrix eucalyptigena]|uniref:Uncharacterized protein n=1 Tax=Sporothrix eucalyptigena TaxID=1812306 RepID=A0ABP0CBV6_9PEZI
MDDDTFARNLEQLMRFYDILHGKNTFLTRIADLTIAQLRTQAADIAGRFLDHMVANPPPDDHEWIFNRVGDLFEYFIDFAKHTRGTAGDGSATASGTGGHEEHHIVIYTLGGEAGPPPLTEIRVDDDEVMEVGMEIDGVDVRTRFNTREIEEAANMDICVNIHASDVEDVEEVFVIGDDTDDEVDTVPIDDFVIGDDDDDDEVGVVSTDWTPCILGCS